MFKKQIKKEIFDFDKEFDKNLMKKQILEKYERNNQKKNKYFKRSLIPISIVIIICGLIVVLNNKKDIFKDDYSKKNDDIKTYETYNFLSSDIIKNAQNSSISPELQYEYTPEKMKEIADIIAVISVISVDYADTKIIISGATYGKMVINNVLYGSIKSGEVINYIKPGGIMTLAEYEKNQPDGAKEKSEELWSENGIDATKIYVNFHFENDPIIEEGKTYLCYLKYNKNIDKYEVIGLGNGFRELNIAKNNVVTAKAYSLDNYQIKNNNTGEYESLKEYIEKYINN